MQQQVLRLLKIVIYPLLKYFLVFLTTFNLLCFLYQERYIVNTLWNSFYEQLICKELEQHKLTNIFFKAHGIKHFCKRDIWSCEGSWGRLSSVLFSHSVVSDSLWPREQQHTRPPCPSPTRRVHPKSCPLSRWCHLTISSSVIPFSCPQSFPASGSFQMSQLFASSGQRIGVSALALVLPMNTQDWSPLGWTGWISLHSKGLSRVFSNTTVQKHQFFGTQLSL